MADLHLSRVTLRDDPATRAIMPLLMPAESGMRAGAVHRLIWSLFGDADGVARDYLWREDVRRGGPRTWYTLGPNLPLNSHNLFDVQSKPFSPDLRQGDRVSFTLRANATKAVKEHPGDRKRGVRRGVVGQRARVLREEAGPDAHGGDIRRRAEEEAPLEWMQRQGGRDGFRVASYEPDADAFGFGFDDEEDEAPLFRVTSCTMLDVPRTRDRDDIWLEVSEIEGTLVVEDPSTFLAAVSRGFGRGRAFGLGMMMLRRG